MTPLEKFLRAAKEAGCPADQILNFRRGQYAPQPIQLPFHAAARECDASDGPTQIGQAGGRGGGKSHAAVCQVVHGDCMRFPGLKWLYLRSIGASARESFSDMLDKALPGLTQHYIQTRSALELPNGSRVILGGFRNERDIDKYVGLEYDGILVDDAHLISKDKYDKIRGSLRTSKLGWRPRVYVTYNPGGIGHAYLKKLFVEPWRLKREDDTRFFFSLPEDNAFLNPEYIQYLDKLTGWLYKAWRKGDFDIAAGQFFTTFNRDVHVVEPFQIPINWKVWMALDYGWIHWNVVHLFAKSADSGDVYVVDTHAARRWIVSSHVSGLEAMLDRNGIHRQQIRRFLAGPDVFSRRDQVTIAQQYEQHGWKLEAAQTDRINGAAEILRRLGDIGQRIKPSVFIFDRCARLIESIPAMQHDPHRPDDVLKVDANEDGDGGDDFYDTFRYGLMEAAIAIPKAFSIPY